MTVEHFRNFLRAQEKVVADGIVDVATELRLADAAELMVMIRNNQNANIADLVNSSTELFFKPGSLKYALSAGCSVGWDSAPTIALDMEFRNAPVCVFFRLMLGRSRAGVEVMDIIFDEKGLDQAEKTQRLAAAIAAARLPVKRAKAG
ncbi:MAG TPA: hypothetical protein VKV96_05460 [Roseiarcus sp.]|nr:hypothetical protein [Roseiarcus sp.]